MSTNEQKPIAFSELKTASGLVLGEVTLQRERALNALNVEMLEALKTQLLVWSRRSDLAAVVMRSSQAKAFCAGGDVKSLVIRPQSGEHDFVERYFSAEYFVDAYVHHCPKPIVIWGEGLVMGGGLGLMNGADLRLMTPSSVVAMPEISIGFFPDVGATYFLSRLPSGVGEFMGLTGARITGADAVHIGLADGMWPNGGYDDLLKTLMHLPWSGRAEADRKHLKSISHPLNPSLQDRRLVPQLNWLASLSGAKDDLHWAERFSSTAPDDPWVQESWKRYQSGSPRSAQVAWLLMASGKSLSLKNTFALEWQVAVHLARTPDFQEGVRSVLIDKDQSPHWQQREAGLQSLDLIRNWIESAEYKYSDFAHSLEEM